MSVAVIVEVGGPSAEHEALDARPGGVTQIAPNSGSFRLSSQFPGCKDPFSQRRIIGVDSPMQKDVSPVQDWPGVGKEIELVEVLVGGVKAEHEALDARPGGVTQMAPNSGSFKLSSQFPGCKDPFSQRRMIGVDSSMQKDVSPVQDWLGVGNGMDVVEVLVGGVKAEHEALDARPGGATQIAPNSGSFRLSSQLPGCKDPFSQRRIIGVESPIQKDVSPVQDWPGVGNEVGARVVLLGESIAELETFEGRLESARTNAMSEIDLMISFILEIH